LTNKSLPLQKRAQTKLAMMAELRCISRMTNSIYAYR